MIEGVTILNQVEQWNPQNIAGLFCCAILIVISIIGLVTIFKDFDSTTIGMIIMQIVAAILLAAILLITIATIVVIINLRETIVQAAIDDSASFVKINEVYKFIRQEGQIYILQLKTP